LDAETKEKLNEIGPVKYIIGADAVHHLFLGEFKKEYPDAKLIAVEDAIQKRQDLSFDGSWGKDAPDTKHGFEDSIQHCYFSGFGNKDVAFLHTTSKTLIQADLLFNLPATEQYSKSKLSAKFPFFGSIGPNSWAQKHMVWNLGSDKEAMKRDAKTVAGWDFDRIIPCHGDVIETDGNKAWRDAYKFYLD